MLPHIWKQGIYRAANLKGFLQQSRAFRFATHYLVLHASGSGKRGRECPLCTPMNAVPPNAGTQLFEEYLSAQPVGDFWILPAVRDGQPPFRVI